MPNPDSYDFLARQPAAIDSAFAVLEAVAELGPGVTARQLVEELPMSRASVYRIIKHLVASEYLVRTPDLRGFVIGERVRVLGETAAAPQREPVEKLSYLDPRRINTPGTAP